jgi:hypothetical protein
MPDWGVWLIVAIAGWLIVSAALAFAFAQTLRQASEETKQRLGRGEAGSIDAERYFLRGRQVGTSGHSRGGGSLERSWKENSGEQRQTDLPPEGEIPAPLRGIGSHGE